jgi:hypothetical protein
MTSGTSSELQAYVSSNTTGCGKVHNLEASSPGEDPGHRAAQSESLFSAMNASANASDRHVDALSTGLHSLISSEQSRLPLRSSELLKYLITSTPPTPGARPAFRLTDQPVLEACLRTLAKNWEHGTLFLQQSQSGELVIVDARLGSSTRPTERKRKRSTDDDTDSAGGSDVEPSSPNGEEDMSVPNEDSQPRLGQLSVELKEVYALLQCGTAKGKLLAEEVRQTPHVNMRLSADAQHSSALICPSSPSVLTLPSLLASTFELRCTQLLRHFLFTLHVTVFIFGRLFGLTRTLRSAIART